MCEAKRIVEDTRSTRHKPGSRVFCVERLCAYDLLASWEA